MTNIATRDDGIGAPVVPERPLEALATAINLSHKAATELAQSALEEAYECGCLLMEAKGRVPHGEWLPWLKTSCPKVAERTAQQYMKLARNRAAIEAKSAGHADLTIADALRLMNEPTDEERQQHAARMAQAGEQAKHEKLVKRLSAAPFASTVFDVADKLADKGKLADLERCAEHLDTLSESELTKLAGTLEKHQAEKAARIDAVLDRVHALTRPVEKDVTPHTPALPVALSPEAEALEADLIEARSRMGLMMNLNGLLTTAYLVTDQSSHAKLMKLCGYWGQFEANTRYSVDRAISIAEAMKDGIDGFIATLKAIKDGEARP